MAIKSFLFSREPLWIENRQGIRRTLPEAVQSWTYEPGSLTRRLRSYYGNSIAVKILFHQWHMPFLSERRLLKLAENKYSLTREVLLHADGKPLIMARTIIPEKTIKVARSNLSHLGNRPLGEVIFSDPALERMEMDVTLIHQSTWTQAARNEAKLEQPVWGRRTVYAIRHRQMLVSEFFLPELLKII